MSGDIGKGTSHACTQLAVKLLKQKQQKLEPPTEEDITKKQIIDFLHQNNESKEIKHFIQVAGGTNNYSYSFAKDVGLIGQKGFGGFAFGGYARKQLGIYLNELEKNYPGAKVENHVDVLNSCMEFANSLVCSVKK
jgi:hypothetical protein